jgi:ATF/CREB family transcription factor
MFPMPEPSPNTLHAFNSEFGDPSVATPGARSFQETAMRQMARTRQAQQSTSHPSIDQTLQVPITMASMPTNLTAMDVKPPTQQYHGQEDSEAVNGLFLLSQSSQAPSHYSMAPHTSLNAHSHPQNMQIDHASDTRIGHRPHASISTQGDGSPDMGPDSDDEPQSKKRKTRAAVVKKSNGKAVQTNGAQKKAPTKGAANKRGKANNMDSASPEAEQEELDLTKAEYDANGKPCNDEEKRKNFLERNRYAYFLLHMDTANSSVGLPH